MLSGINYFLDDGETHYDISIFFLLVKHEVDGLRCCKLVMNSKIYKEDNTRDLLVQAREIRGAAR
jgi:hypothetical protein